MGKTTEHYYANGDILNGFATEFAKMLLDRHKKEFKKFGKEIEETLEKYQSHQIIKEEKVLKVTVEPHIKIYFESN